LAARRSHLESLAILGIEIVSPLSVFGPGNVIPTRRAECSVRRYFSCGAWQSGWLGYKGRDGLERCREEAFNALFRVTRKPDRAIRGDAARRATRCSCGPDEADRGGGTVDARTAERSRRAQS